MENFKSNDEEKLRAESMMDDVSYNRNQESEDKTGVIFRTTQRYIDVNKDSDINKSKLKIIEKSKNIERRNELIKELEDKKRRYEILIQDKNQLSDANEFIEKIDKLIAEAKNSNEIDSYESEGLLYKINSNKTKPEENNWKN